MTSPVIVKNAIATDEASIIDVLVRAFRMDPAVRWVWSDSQQYNMHFPDFVKAFGGKAFTYGTAYYVDNYMGAALWLPPDIQPDENMLMGVLQQTVPQHIQKDAFAVFDQMSRYHPSESHWYLPLMGIDPFRQGKGFGSALLRHTLVRCDHENKLAYLESSSPKNIPLYERHGFELLGTIQSGTSPPIFPMLRKPK